MWVIPVGSHSCSCQGAEWQCQSERAPSSQLTQLSQAAQLPARHGGSAIVPQPHRHTGPDTGAHGHLQPSITTALPTVQPQGLGDTCNSLAVPWEWAVLPTCWGSNFPHTHLSS